MDWQAIDAPYERTLLAQTIVDLSVKYGIRKRTLTEASIQAFHDPDRWRVVFPSGPTQALWFVSKVSDASMALTFAAAPASSLAAVIDIRFDQNVALKPFVGQVMRYDLSHPFQALSRMQRTARVMYGCLSADPKPGFWRLAALNLLYTGLVFIWLTETAKGNPRTKAATRAVMSWLSPR